MGHSPVIRPWGRAGYLPRGSGERPIYAPHALPCRSWSGVSWWPGRHSGATSIEKAILVAVVTCNLTALLLGTRWPLMCLVILRVRAPDMPVLQGTFLSILAHCRGGHEPVRGLACAFGIPLPA